MRIACMQSHVQFGEPKANAERARGLIQDLKAEGVDLAVFPECFLTGYAVESRKQAESIAIDVEGEVPPTPVRLLQDAVNDAGIHAIVGFAGRGPHGLYNGAMLLAPRTPIRRYAKTHLPEIGLDNYVVPGASLPVFDMPLGRIGILICFDLRAPEAARTLTLKGAELIVLPTNWPEGAETSAEHVSITRAAENRVFMATCNRVGTEHGFRFIGRSKIIGPTGKVLASAGDDEQVIMADIDLAEAREKRTVNIPGVYEFSVLDSRRPELYGVLTERHKSVSTW